MSNLSTILRKTNKTTKLLKQINNATRSNK